MVSWKEDSAVICSESLVTWKDDSAVICSESSSWHFNGVKTTKMPSFFRGSFWKVEILSQIMNDSPHVVCQY